MIKVGYFGDGKWAHYALQKLSENPEIKITFIVPRFDSRDPILKKASEDLCCPFLVESNVNSKAAINKFGKFDCDLFISMSFDQILKQPIIGMPSLGFINCHAGSLPFYRGRNPLNWVLINGEQSFGITVHYIDQGIDTGDIIEQVKFPISKFDNYRTLLDKASVECGNVLDKAVKKIIAKNVMPIRQVDLHPKGSYFRKRINGDENIKFQWGAERCFNFIRGISKPGPGARCIVNGQEYSIEQAELVKKKLNDNAVSGEVVERNHKGIIIKTGYEFLQILAMINSNDENGNLFKPVFEIGTIFMEKDGKSFRE